MSVHKSINKHNININTQGLQNYFLLLNREKSFGFLSYLLL